MCYTHYLPETILIVLLISIKNYVAITQIQISNSMGEIVEHEVLVGNNSEGMYKIVLTESGSN